MYPKANNPVRCPSTLPLGLALPVSLGTPARATAEGWEHFHCISSRGHTSPVPSQVATHSGDNCGHGAVN